MSQTGRAKLYYSSRDRKWVWTVIGGVERMTMDSAGLITINQIVATGVATLGDTKLNSLVVGDTGTALANMFSVVGSSVAIAAIGSYQVEVGSIQATGVLANDSVVVNPRTAPPADVSVGPFRVSGTNNINFYVHNSDIAAQASYPAMGWSIKVIR